VKLPLFFIILPSAFIKCSINLLHGVEIVTGESHFFVISHNIYQCFSLLSYSNNSIHSKANLPLFFIIHPSAFIKCSINLLHGFEIFECTALSHLLCQKSQHQFFSLISYSNNSLHSKANLPLSFIILPSAFIKCSINFLHEKYRCGLKSIFFHHLPFSLYKSSDIQQCFYFQVKVLYIHK